ncbi:MAG: CPBP family intramembrane glutamic endopeptidase [Candidatus Omnitrophota bacterium]
MKIFKIVKNNKLYTVLFLFVLLINILVFTDWIMEKFSPSKKPEVTLTQCEASSHKDDIKASQDKLSVVAKQNPLLYFFLAMFNFTLLFMLLIGLILDLYFLRQWIKKKKIDICILSQKESVWGISDVVRVILINMSFGYTFLIIQGTLSKVFPVVGNENFRMIFNTMIMNVIGISVVLYFVIKKGKQNIEAVGLTSQSFTKSVFYAVIGYISLGPLLVLIMTGTFFVIDFFHYKPQVQSIVQIFVKENNLPVLFFSTLFAGVFGPIVEEIFFRGFMYSAIKKSIGVLGAMIITSVVFSLLHAHVIGFLPIMTLGLLLAYLYEKTGSLTASITVHIMHNVAMLVLVFLVRCIGAQ